MAKYVEKSYPPDHPIFSSGPQFFKPMSRPPMKSREAKPDAPIYTRGWAIGVTKLPKPAPKKPSE